MDDCPGKCFQQEQDKATKGSQEVLEDGWGWALNYTLQENIKVSTFYDTIS